MKDRTFSMNIQDNKAKAEVVLRLLNDALATELVCMVHHKRHY